MAYVSQDMKKRYAPEIKRILKKYNLKGSISVNNHSTLVLTVAQGPLDFIENGEKIARETAARRGQTYYPNTRYCADVNVYWIADHYDGVVRACLLELNEALKGPDYFNESDAQIDYFHRSHYWDIKIGRWNKPYVLIK